MTTKILKGDVVEIISGEDRGHQGEVQRVIRKRKTDGSPDPNRTYVIVAGANMVMKHQRRTGRVSTQTGIIEMEAPIHISNVALVGTSGSATKVGYEVADNGEKTRMDRRSGQPLPKPKN